VPSPLWARIHRERRRRAGVVAVALARSSPNAPIDYDWPRAAADTTPAARSTLDALNRRLAHVL